MRLTTHLDLRVNYATRLFLAHFCRGLLAAVQGLALVAGAPAQTPAVAAADASRYLDTIKALTVPAMEGRGDDTKGIMRAADLLEQRYKSLGLEPAGTNGYLQPFSVITGAKLAGNNRVVEQVAADKKELRLNEDFVPFSFSSSGEASAPMVFAGYGASADEFHYDDYSGIDAKGKIVVLLRYEPAGFAAKSGGQGLTRYATLVTKAINARNHGAAAVVIVNGAPEGKTGSGGEDLLTRFGSVSGPEDTGIMLVQVKNAEAQEWFEAAGKTLRGVQDEINASTKPESFAFPDSVHLTLDVHIETERATVNNVLAYLPGKSDEYVIIGAHYDHLGYGHYDSLAPAQIGQIHPGADDNASGTAGVLELARLLAPLKGQLPRGGRLGEGAYASARQSRGDAEHGYDRAHPGREGVHRRRGNRIDVCGNTHEGGERISVSCGEFGRGLRVERPHVVCGEADSGAVLFLGAALGLPPAVGHLGQDQCAGCG
ncbi:MAG: M28 family peptidase, partial [Candidatus Acidiferrales bacterium]